MRGKSILITGGSGSFGHAFVKKVLQEKPARLIIFSRDEQKQDQMQHLFDHPALRFFIGDVRDAHRLEMAMYGVDLVIHAAAMKIVPTCEYNPFEAVMTNVCRAENVCRAAMATAVDFVLSSTEMMQGREIFIPKIPSMHILDLAEAIAPGEERKFTGIRPGEKLHEVLLTEDEVHLAMEAHDRFILNGGPSNAKIPRYSSDTNPDFLSVEDLRRML